MCTYALPNTPNPPKQSQVGIALSADANPLDEGQRRAAVDKILAWESGTMPAEERQALIDQEDELRYVVRLLYVYVYYIYIYVSVCTYVYTEENNNTHPLSLTPYLIYTHNTRIGRASSSRGRSSTTSASPARRGNTSARRPSGACF